MNKNTLKILTFASLILAILFLIFYLGSLYGQVKAAQIFNETIYQTIKLECLP